MSIGGSPIPEAEVASSDLFGSHPHNTAVRSDTPISLGDFTTSDTRLTKDEPQMGSTVRHIYDNGLTDDTTTLFFVVLAMLFMLMGLARRNLIIMLLGAILLCDMPWGMSLMKRSGVLVPVFQKLVGRDEL